MNFLQNNNDDQPSVDDDQPQNTEDNDPVAFAEFTSKIGWEEIQRANLSMLAIAEAFEIKRAAKVTDEDLNGHIVKLKTKTDKMFAIADSGSPMSFLNETTARRLQQNDKSTIFKYIPMKDAARNLACYNGKFIVPKGGPALAKKSGGWTIQSASFFVIDDEKANILSRNF